MTGRMHRNSAGTSCKQALTEQVTDQLILPLLPLVGMEVLGDLRGDAKLDRVHHMDLLVAWPGKSNGSAMAVSMRARCDHERKWKDFTQTTRHANGAKGEASRGHSAVLVLAYVRSPHCRERPGPWGVTELLVGDLEMMRKMGPDSERPQNPGGNGQWFGTWSYERHPQLVMARIFPDD